MTLTRLCLNGARCVDLIDGHARETNAPNTFCDSCLVRTVAHVEAIPGQFASLHAMIGERHVGIDAGIRRPKPGSTVPLNLHIDTLMGEIVATTTMAAEILADVMAMNNPEHYPAHKQVTACAAIIAPNLPRLLVLTGIEVMFWTKSGLGHGITMTTGNRIVAELDKLASRAHFTLGLTRARAERDFACTRCRAKTVGRWAGSDDFDCTTCGSRFPEDDLRRQDKILLALVKRGLVSADEPTVAVA